MRLPSVRMCAAIPSYLRLTYRPRPNLSSLRFVICRIIVTVLLRVNDAPPLYFAQVLTAADARNDFYVFLLGGTFLQDNKTSAKNVEISIRVCDSKGNTIPVCARRSSLPNLLSMLSCWSCTLPSGLLISRGWRCCHPAARIQVHRVLSQQFTCLQWYGTSLFNDGIVVLSNCSLLMVCA